jgi:peroxiredoxin family protein
MHVHLAAQLYGVKKEDLVELVDDIRGAEYFLEEVYGGIIMYL